jgi:hypothetical protein
MSDNIGDGDKRKVSTDALETLGTIIDENEKRDAIHLAVCPVVAKEKLHPGQDVGADGTTKEPVGIVDPFLKKDVLPGQYFWLVIYPRQINSLRHVWSHPAFPDECSVKSSAYEESYEWIKQYAESLDRKRYECDPYKGYDNFPEKKAPYDPKKAVITAESLIEAANQHIWMGCRLVSGSDFEGEELDENFWHHFEIVTGTKVPPSSKTNFFSCSC